MAEAILGDQEWAVVEGDCRTVLSQLAPGSISTVITSPPYAFLRNYAAGEGEIGQEPTIAGYVESVCEAFDQLRPALDDRGVVWLNLGDSYAGSGGDGGFNARIENQVGRTRITELAPKQLMGIPWRVALALQDRGWWLRSEVIWSKPGSWETVNDRPARSHEHLFMLAKNPHYYFDTDAIRVPSKVEGLRRLVRRTTVWEVAPSKGVDGAHFAVFPSELIMPCILSSCPPGGVVCDPFCGSGTTGIATLQAGGDRRFVGIELNPASCELSRRLIEKAAAETVTARGQLTLDTWGAQMVFRGGPP